MPKTEGLTEKQKIFCREYIYDWNATRAAKAAGYSEDTAGSMGAENLKKPQIQAYIAEIQKDLEKIAGVSRLRLVQEHLKIINTSIAHLHNTWIERKKFDKLTDDQKAAIQEISTQLKTTRGTDGTLEENEYIKIKLYDRQKSMDSLTKMFGYAEAEKLIIIPEKQTFTIGGQKIEF
jgi:phage terminase small subunit